MGMRLDSGQFSRKLVDIHLDSGRCIERDLGTLNEQHIIGQFLSQPGKVAPQIHTCRRLIRFRPKERCQYIASMRLARNGRIGQQSQALTPTYFENLICLTKAGRSE
jgi:hypothetical protein